MIDMQSTKQSNRLRSRVISFAVLVAFIFFAALAFVFNPIPVSRADEETPEQRTESGIRFVQVAAGEDFAIGLTYDRKLYGWSIKSTRNTTPQTLGDYYGEDPEQVNVEFRVGPGTTDNGWTNTAYHGKSTSGDYIVAIAATRYTASFITDRGYIYTWGRDDGVYRDVSTNADATYGHSLLLRPCDTHDNWYEPYIINYGYYNDDHAMEAITPGKGYTVQAITAGEYNYMLLLKGNYNGNLATHTNDAYFTFVWGSVLYSAVNEQARETAIYTSLSGGENTRHIYKTVYAGENSAPAIAAGGYTVAVNGTAAAGATSLQIHGKNFIMSQGVTAGSGTTAGGDTTYNNYTVVNTTQIVTPAASVLSSSAISPSAPAGAAQKSIFYTQGSVNYNLVGAIAGGNGAYDAEDALTGFDPERYYARQKYTSTLTYGINRSQTDIVGTHVLDNTDTKLQKYTVGEVEKDSAKPELFAVSLGNDVGYGISSGNLFAWGDNSVHQLANAATANTGYSDVPVQITGLSNLMSVAAGKQLSAGDPDNLQNKKRAFNAVDTFSVDGSGNATFADDVKNTADFITGALTSSGALYVWSNANNGAVTPLTFGNASGDKIEAFSAVYSGYGNNLFAVTVRGKLVRITYNSTNSAFDMFIYDKFYSGKMESENQHQTWTKTEITNWTVDSTNTVVFESQTPSRDNVAPSLGSATFYVWSAATVTGATAGEDGTAEQSVSINGTQGYKELVASNAIGDAYRIVGLTGDGSLVYQKSANGALDSSNYVPTFEYDGKAITSVAQRNNLFAFEMVNDENGVGIKITPRQSTHGKTVTINFYIARYNSYQKFSATQDNAIYYDYKPCKIAFSVKDTATVIAFAAFEGEDNTGNSNIPLLDPNNNYNKYYSIAVQNASVGVDELIKFITTRSTSVDAELKNAALAQMKNKDVGFPDSAKIEAGNLDYYLGDTVAANKYNDVYQYIFADRDTDRVTIAPPDSTLPIMARDSITTARGATTITVELDLSAASLHADFTDKTAAEATRIVSTDFFNNYGLYNISFSEDMSKLTFCYDVLTFQAVNSSGTLVYNGGDITDYRTVRSSEAAIGASLLANTVRNFDYSVDGGYTEINTDTARTRANNVAFVFSAPSLRLKPNFAGANKPQIDINGEYGGGKNTYKIVYSEFYPEDSIYVGDTKTINLVDFFGITDLTTMSFTFNNRRDAESLDDFDAQFTDDTGNGIKVAELQSRTLTVRPTTSANIDLDLSIQRFSDTGFTVPFTAGTNAYDEKITVTIVFDNIIDFKLTKTDATVSSTVTQNSIIDVFGETEGALNGGPLVTIERATNGTIGSTVARAALRSNASIFGLKSNASDVFGCEVRDKTKIAITPKTSGTGTINFVVVVFGKTVFFEMVINVSAVTQYTEIITVAEDKYLPVQDLTSCLASANSFNENIDDYRILYQDIANPEASDINKSYNAIYFTRTINDTEHINPTFIKNVVFENVSTNPTLRIVSGNSMDSDIAPVYMHIMYTSDQNATTYAGAASGSVIELIVEVRSGKVKLLDTSTGSALVVDIDCRNPSSNAEWWSIEGKGLDVSVTVDLTALLNEIDLPSASLYKIFMVRTDDEAANYFDYSTGGNDKSVIIKPTYNTPRGSDGVSKTYEMALYVYLENSSNDPVVYSFEVSVDGIVTTLPVMTEDGIIGYGNIWLYSFAIVFGVLLVIFVIRMIVYLKKRSKQRAIIKRNQELIRLRDRMHNKATSATRDQVVRTKLKMEDPKYAKLFNEMRKNKENESGITLENSDLAATAAKKSKKKGGKKGGKKSVAELKAELEAKRAAFAASQTQNAQPVNPFAGEMPMDGGFNGEGGFAGDAGFNGEGGFNGDGGFTGDGGFNGDGGFAGDGNFAAQDIDGNAIIFDAPDGDGNM